MFLIIISNSKFMKFFILNSLLLGIKMSTPMKIQSKNLNLNGIPIYHQRFFTCLMTEKSKTLIFLFNQVFLKKIYYELSSYDFCNKRHNETL